jgi:ketosteroid isomerase-like protein
MSAAASGHPSNADRERAALPAVEAYARALAAGDAEAASALCRDDAVWLWPGGRAEGASEVAARHRVTCARPLGAAPAVAQHGAHALLTWEAGARIAGAVIESRSGAVVMRADLVA